MREYSPKRRTAVVFTGIGTTGAYHAGVLRALDESGVKIDLVVGSGAGAITAAFAAVGGGTKLYGPGGLWDGARFSSFYRLRPALHVALSLVGISFAIIALPVALGLVLGLLFPLLLIADRAAPGSASRALQALWVAPEAMSGPYLAAQAVPVFALAMVAIVVLGLAYWRRRARLAEAFESFLDAEPGLRRVRRGLWEVARGVALKAAAPGDGELGRSYASLLAENLGEPGFRELIVRTADLDRGAPLAFALLREADEHGRQDHEDHVDLRAPGQAELFFDALATGLLLPVALPLRRVTFPKGAVHAGETHRLTDAALVSGCGIADAIDAGAEQVVVVTGDAGGSGHAAASARALRPHRRDAAHARAAGDGGDRVGGAREPDGGDARAPLGRARSLGGSRERARPARDRPVGDPAAPAVARAARARRGDGSCDRGAAHDRRPRREGIPGRLRPVHRAGRGPGAAAGARGRQVPRPGGEPLKERGSGVADLEQALAG